jgi:hypothetical protein
MATVDATETLRRLGRISHISAMLGRGDPDGLSTRSSSQWHQHGACDPSAAWRSQPIGDDRFQEFMRELFGFFGQSRWARYRLSPRRLLRAVDDGIVELFIESLSKATHARTVAAYDRAGQVASTEFEARGADRRAFHAAFWRMAKWIGNCFRPTTKLDRTQSGSPAKSSRSTRESSSR